MKLIDFLFPTITFTKDDFSLSQLEHIEKEEIEFQGNKKTQTTLFLFAGVFLIFFIFNLFVFNIAGVYKKYSILYCIHYIVSMLLYFIIILKFPLQRRFASLFIIGSMGMAIFSIGFLLANDLDNLNSYKYVAVYYGFLLIGMVITIFLYRIYYKKIARPEIFTKTNTASKKGIIPIIIVIGGYTFATFLLSTFSLHTVGVLIILFSIYFCYVEVYCLVTALHFPQIIEIYKKESPKVLHETT